MKLKQWKEQLDKLIAEHPEALEMEVVAANQGATDNYFRHVYYQPSILHIRDLTNYQLESTGDTPNAVCIN